LKEELTQLFRVTLDLNLHPGIGVSYPSGKPHSLREAIDRGTKSNALNSALKHDAKAFGLG
jgi:hypothetical protein